jgi:hypothetical protein
MKRLLYIHKYVLDNSSMCDEEMNKIGSSSATTAPPTHSSSSFVVDDIAKGAASADTTERPAAN